MNVAITADVHLGGVRHPERYRALETILSQMADDAAAHLIIAGDLFDAELRDAAAFEALCRSPAGRRATVHIIPGNHDAGLSGKDIAADNVTVYTEPALVRLGGGPEFLFLPYRAETGMGAELAPWAARLKGRPWVLVAHGDYVDGPREAHPAEPGLYMPLSRRDLGACRPLCAFLGHVHKPLDGPPVWIPGSPCGLDVNETGVRRFLMFDSASGSVESRRVRGGVTWFRESFVVVPVPDEAAALRAEIVGRIAGWGLSADERAAARVRVTLSGYSADRQALRAAVLEGFRGVAFVDEQGPDLGGVRVARDELRQAIAVQVRDRLAVLERPGGPDEPDNGRILARALSLIYGGP